MRATEHSRGNAGMTILELVVGMMVSSLVVMMIGSLYLSTVTLARRGTNLWELANASIAMETLSRDVRRASRHPDGIVIWVRETNGVRHDAIGVGEKPKGWTYFVHEPQHGELRRHRQGSERVAALPPERGGVVLARSVRSFSVTRRQDLVTVDIVAGNAQQVVRLRTDIRPGNE